MSNIFKYSLLLVVLGISLAMAAETNVSEERIAYGRQVANAAWKKSGRRDAVVAEVARALARRYPVLGFEPVSKPITQIESFRDYDRKFQQILDEKFPVYTDRQLDSLAAEKFPLYKRGDRTTVYYARGNRIESVTGLISAIEDGRVIIAARRVSFSEMRQVEGNEPELLKFIPEDNEKAREAYKREVKASTAEKRADFRQNHHKDVEQALLAKDRKANELAGYTYCDKQWLTPSALAAWISDAVAEELENARFEELNRNMKHRREPIDAQRQSLAIRYLHDQPGWMANPEARKMREASERQSREALEQAEQQAVAVAQRDRDARLAAAKAAREEAAAKAKAVAEAKAAAKAKAAAEAKAAEEARLAEAAEEAKAAEEARAAAKAKAAADERQRELEAQRQLEADANGFMAGDIGGIPMPAIMIFGGLVVLAGLGAMIFLMMRRRQEQDEDTFKKFFEGKGKLQKDFWSQADADPEHFKYVAYLFPSLEEATKALSHLSYMRMTGSGGDLRCTRQLNYGVYPHLTGAVCFVGGVKFSYALWREASAVLPELPGAQYFKVSTEPKVMLDVPDLAKLAEGKNLHIESLGQEDQEGEHGEFNRVYKYRATTRDEAMAFLENFNVNEAGIIVQVETPDGILGKDENGLFTLEANALDNGGLTEEKPQTEETADNAAPAEELTAPEEPAQEPAPVKLPKLKIPSKK